MSRKVYARSDGKDHVIFSIPGSSNQEAKWFYRFGSMLDWTPWTPSSYANGVWESPHMWKHNVASACFELQVHIAGEEIIFNKQEALANGPYMGKSNDDVEIDAAAHMKNICANLWSKRNFADCDISTKDSGVSWRVHRSVLAAASPVLGRMLESEMKEGRAGSIAFQGAETADVEAFLYYLYHGTLPHASEEAPEKLGDKWSAAGLMELADMYEVPGLLKIAATALVQSVRVDNVVTVSRAINKRKNKEVVAPAYKKLKQLVKDTAALQEQLIDSI
eukprot:TRINITY_DN59690_c0_g1_i1.p1 TRINITY_DN59690_c0_g1~~TRINITY_DN59690_c0_g1_i1.p1  ORF type:complete len:277 (-),score=61.86 TRINITY_DN59690_c0_g1_i1:206-1036(-)